MLRERTRWAMHVHDGLTQSVTSAVLELQTLRHRIEADPDVAVEALHEVEDAIRHDLTGIREVLFELQEGRVRDERSFATFISGLVERWRLPARVSIEGDVDSVPHAVLDVAQHIIAEALTNAVEALRFQGCRDPRAGRRPGSSGSRSRIVGRDSPRPPMTIPISD